MEVIFLLGVIIFSVKLMSWKLSFSQLSRLSESWLYCNHLANICSGYLPFVYRAPQRTLSTKLSSKLERILVFVSLNCLQNLAIAAKKKLEHFPIFLNLFLTLSWCTHLKISAGEKRFQRWPSDIWTWPIVSKDIWRCLVASAELKFFLVLLVFHTVVLLCQKNMKSKQIGLFLQFSIVSTAWLFSSSGNNCCLKFLLFL